MFLRSLVFSLVVFLAEAHQELREVLAASGSTAILPCECGPSSSSAPAILWTKYHSGTVWKRQRSGFQLWGTQWTSGGRRRVALPHFKLDAGDCSLQMDGLMATDGGLYVCSVQREPRGPFVQQMVVLRVIQVSLSAAAPVAGSQVTIGCQVTPWPRDASIRWELNNSTREVDGGRTFTVQAATTLTGTWTCVVRHDHAEGRASAPLKVRGIVDPPGDTRIYVAAGSPVALPCIFTPGVTPSSPAWFKLKASSPFKPVHWPLPTSFSAPAAPGLAAWDHSASLGAAMFEDGGRYRCSAELDGQNLSRDLLVVVARIDSSVQSQNFLTLTCQLSDASEVIRYEWVQVTSEPGTFPNPIWVGETLRLSRGSGEDQAEWACRFYGNQGLLGNVTRRMHTTSQLSRQRLASSSKNTPILVGVSLLLLLLLLVVLAQLYKNHQRRKRLLQFAALESIVHSASNKREEKQRRK